MAGLIRRWRTSLIETADSASETPGELKLPDWAVVTEARRQHVRRVVSLLAQWAHDLKLPTNASLEWIDAGRFHDALKDAPVHVLRQVTRAAGMPAALLHGPAAARTLEARGEARRGVIEAVEHHSIGFPGWGPAGRALYCADFLEPGRRFDPEMAAFLRRRFLRHPTDVFRDVLRLRIERALELKEPVHPQTLETWNSVR